MRFVLAPDSFKESMTAKEVCIAMEKGIKRVFPSAECIHVPMADGGEGTVQSLVDATGGKLYFEKVTGPLGTIVESKFGILGDGETAVIEMAEASGLHLVDPDVAKRNPLVTTTYGTGELIKAALDKGVKKVLIGLGGSATNDGGAGMLQALGARLISTSGDEVAFGGGELWRLSSIDTSNLDKRLSDVEVIVACDVKNPLTGENGASYVFGPQKGATKERVEILDRNLKHYAKVIKEQFNIDVDNQEGAGAAGGLGAALLGFCNAQLKSGIDIVIEYSRLEEKTKGADYVFTGEGSIDSQTKFGKTPVGVAKIAKKQGASVIALAGRIGDGIEDLYDLGIDSVIGILPGAISLEKALATGKENIEVTTENVCRILELK